MRVSQSVRMSLSSLIVFSVGLSWQAMWSSLAAQEANLIEVGKRMEKRVFRRANGFELPYRLLIPAGYSADKKWPIIVFFHGIGERGTDNEAQLKHPQFIRLAIDEKDPCFLVAPQCPPTSTWTELRPNFRQGFRQAAPATEPMLAVIELLEALAKEFSIDPDRWYATGLSMGGFATFDLLIRKPEWFAAGVPLCGGMPEDEAPKIAHIPLWIFHGAEDKAVPVELSRRAVKALQAAGAKAVKYTEYPDVGHDVWRRAYLEPELRDWLLAQRRQPR
ncbi:MAG: prolyl oligopeptidase family serine peptidase [Thermoguttaceae bacterium]|nr:prolyl oligopeptidase family serine peptidase [Thermoguttaceae bacterium]MDW8079357.1 prolyl oligopeptidase family serine peptidase [Thermoguttaceae bacterium]